MRILAIDPGYERLGIAVLEKNKGGSETLIFSECFKTKKEDDFYDRVLELGKEVERIIKEYQPKELAIETLFFNANQKTAMGVSEARGVVTYQAKKEGLEIFQYSPLQIKTAITGSGRADKKQMIFLLPKLIPLTKEIQYDDEYDAIACGLTHFAHRKNNLLKNENKITPPS